MNNNLCRELFLAIKKMPFVTSSNDFSFNRQLRILEYELSINCLEYGKKFVIDLIDVMFECSNNGLVDSIKFNLQQIDNLFYCNLSFYFLFENLNLLLMNTN